MVQVMACCLVASAGVILLMHPANERQPYIVMLSLIGWVHS